jgi:hypothetical protein
MSEDGAGRRVRASSSEARGDEPGETQLRWHPVAVTPDVAVVQGETVYRPPPHIYSNLWVIRLDAAGRWTEFTQWWMRHPD